MSSEDYRKFHVPTTVAGRSFKSVNDLQKEIVHIRDRSDGKLDAAQEELMVAVFEYHPEAQRKLKGMQFVAVGPNSKSNDPRDRSFYIMTSEKDGDDISYMKCLRRLSELASQQAAGEHVIPLATVTAKYEGLAIQMGSSDILVEPGALTVFGVRVELSRKLLSLHTQTRVYGPWELNHGSDDRLYIVADMFRDDVTAFWKAPFQVLRGNVQAQPQDVSASAEPSLRLCLDTLAQRAGVSGVFTTSSDEELEHAAGQAVVKALSASAQVVRSRAGASAQIQSLHTMAKHQAYELLQEALHHSQTKLRKVEGERELAQLSIKELQDELAKLRPLIFPPEAAPPAEHGTQDPNHEAECPKGSFVRSHGDPANIADIEALSKQLREHLPEPAATMLRNSLSLMSSELYSGPSRALWELLQNADDCKYEDAPHIRIVEHSKYLWLQYNETGFNFEDVKALCSLGMSMKGPGQTGHKGVGFKASFVLSSRPHVLSNPYRRLVSMLHFVLQPGMDLSRWLVCGCMKRMVVRFVLAAEPNRQIGFSSMTSLTASCRT